MGEYARAVDYFQKCIEAEASYTQAYRFLGLSLQGMGRTNEAAEVFKEAREMQLQHGGYVIKGMDLRLRVF